jgi:hypothetical protein
METPQAPIRLFVYNSNVVPCTDHRRGQFLFEQKLVQLFDAQRRSVLTTSTPTFEVTTQPQHADLFYHPACLVDAFFMLRDMPRRAKPRAQATAMERAIINEMDSAGFTHMPHVISALRCHTYHGHGEHALAPLFFPRLWNMSDRRFHRFCAEALPDVDPLRSAHMPYCPPARAPQLPFMPNRSTLVLFIGSNHTSDRRVQALNGIAHTPRSHIILLKSRDPGVVWNGAPLELMRDAVYTLCPHGDTPESQRIYQALAMGSVPLLDYDFQKPAFANWSSFSTLIRYHQGGTAKGLLLPSLRQQQRLQRSAWLHSHVFECEPRSNSFVAYVAHALMRFASNRGGGGSNLLLRCKPRKMRKNFRRAYCPQHYTSIPESSCCSGRAISTF